MADLKINIMDTNTKEPAFTFTEDEKETLNRAVNMAKRIIDISGEMPHSKLSECIYCTAWDIVNNINDILEIERKQNENVH